MCVAAPISTRAVHVHVVVHDFFWRRGGRVLFWIHFLVLMTTFGSVFGAGFAGKALLVLLNVMFGLPAVMSWAAFGTALRRAFSTPSSAIALNRAMGASLFAVAARIAIQ